jgi:SLT domain-containing protein
VHLASYVQLLERGSQTLAESYRVLAEGHGDEPEIVGRAEPFAEQCDHHIAQLAEARKRYGDHQAGPPDRLHLDGLTTARQGGLGMLRDLHEVYAAAAFLDLAWTIVKQAAQGNRDEDLLATATSGEKEIADQLAWLRTQVKTASAQTLLVAD